LADESCRPITNRQPQLKSSQHASFCIASFGQASQSLANRVKKTPRPLYTQEARTGSIPWHLSAKSFLKGERYNSNFITTLSGEKTLLYTKQNGFGCQAKLGSRQAILFVEVAMDRVNHDVYMDDDKISSRSR
jgi:DNA-dependent RNA polymerase auxiliary subunit epsilon